MSSKSRARQMIRVLVARVIEMDSLMEGSKLIKNARALLKEMEDQKKPARKVIRSPFLGREKLNPRDVAILGGDPSL